MLKFQISSRAEYYRLKALDPTTLTYLERAACFLYLQRACFGSKLKHTSFGRAVERPARFDMTKLKPMLEKVHERLSIVTIENLDWLELINRYDCTATLFYLDPPYFGNENDYGKGLFNRDQFALMAARLAQIKESFIISINDRSQIRDLFSNFYMREVRLTYCIDCNDKNFLAKELIISNSP